MTLIVADRVFETTTTTGTGALTLAGAVVGFRAFDDVCANNDTAYYSLWAVDGNGNPSGAWETGLGTFTDTDTLTRTTVHASSNAGAAVDLAAGTKYVQLAATSRFLNLEHITVACSDETTAITTGDAIVTFPMPPYATTLLAVYASLSTSSSSGAVTVDLNEGGSTILSTKITIDQSETDSDTAATPAVISDAALAARARVSVDIDGAGTGAKGLKVTLVYART